MLTLIRQSTRQLRFWLMAAAAILVLTSVLEASHVHDVFTPVVDDHCALCQHPVVLDKILNTTALLLLPTLLAVYVISQIAAFVPTHNFCFALIRAPPAPLHTH